MKRKTLKWLVIVLLLTLLSFSCSKGGDVGSKENEAAKQNKPVMRYDPEGLLEIKKKSDKRINEINDGHMKQLQDMQNENQEGKNEN